MRRAFRATRAAYPRHPRRLAGLLAATVALALLATACGAPARAASTKGAPVVTVVTGLWPLQQAIAAIGQGNVRAVDVVPAGQDPRTWRLDGGARSRVRSADLVVELGGGWQPTLTAAARGARHVLDLSRAIPHLPPYPWLNPYTMESIARAIAASLDRVDPQAKGTFANGEQDEQALLGSLDADFQSTLGSGGCATQNLVNSDQAFTALDTRYQVHVVPIDGATPAPFFPDKATVAHELQVVRRAGVHEIYYDTWQKQDGLLEVEAEAQVKLGTLDPLTGIPPGGWPKGLKSYLNLMEYDLGAITNALGCPQPGL